MKALILSLATVCVLMASSTASAGIRVRVGSVGVAVGRRPAARPVRHAHVAPRPARPAVVHSRRSAAQEVVEERRDTFQDVVEERQDTVQDVREERVDRVRDIIQSRRHAWALLQNQP